MATTMAELEQTPSKSAVPPRRYKASELPLPSATRAAIESLANGFKKKGDYDAIRKQVWDSFETSVCILISSLFPFPFPPIQL